MFASKIVTFNKMSFLNRLAGEVCSSQDSHKEYFNIGHPIDSPPTLRGSMIIEFNMSFILDNEDFFEYGSPVDIGSLMAGYIEMRNSASSDIKMSFFNFSKLLAEVSKVDNYGKHAFLRHEITDVVHGILKENIRLDIADFIRSDKNPHSRLFEFCLVRGYKIDTDHIKKIHIPNTYTNSMVMKRISARFKGRIMTFNPKYGFENRNVA